MAFWNRKGERLAQEAWDLAQASVDMQVRRWLDGRTLELRGGIYFAQLGDFVNVSVVPNWEGLRVQIESTFASEAAYKGLWVRSGDTYDFIDRIEACIRGSKWGDTLTISETKPRYGSVRTMA